MECHMLLHRKKLLPMHNVCSFLHSMLAKFFLHFASERQWHLKGRRVPIKPHSIISTWTLHGKLCLSFHSIRKVYFSQLRFGFWFVAKLNHRHYHASCKKMRSENIGPQTFHHTLNSYYDLKDHSKTINDLPINPRTRRKNIPERSASESSLWYEMVGLLGSSVSLTIVPHSEFLCHHLDLSSAACFKKILKIKWICILFPY